MDDSSERSLLLCLLYPLVPFLLFSCSNLRLFRFRNRPFSLSTSRRAWMVTAHAPLLFLTLESRASSLHAPDSSSLSLSLPTFVRALARLRSVLSAPHRGLPPPAHGPRPALTSVCAESPRALVGVSVSDRRTVPRRVPSRRVARFSAKTERPRKRASFGKEIVSDFEKKNCRWRAATT